MESDESFLSSVPDELSRFNNDARKMLSYLKKLEKLPNYVYLKTIITDKLTDPTSEMLLPTVHLDFAKVDRLKLLYLEKFSKKYKRYGITVELNKSGTTRAQTKTSDDVSPNDLFDYANTAHRDVVNYIQNTPNYNDSELTKILGDSMNSISEFITENKQLPNINVNDMVNQLLIDSVQLFFIAYSQYADVNFSRSKLINFALNNCDEPLLCEIIERIKSNADDDEKVVNYYDYERANYYVRKVIDMYNDEHGLIKFKCNELSSIKNVKDIPEAEIARVKNSLVEIARAERARSSFDEIAEVQSNLDELSKFLPSSDTSQMMTASSMVEQNNRFDASSPDLAIIEDMAIPQQMIDSPPPPPVIDETVYNIAYFDSFIRPQTNIEMNVDKHVFNMPAYLREEAITTNTMFKLNNRLDELCATMPADETMAQDEISIQSFYLNLNNLCDVPRRINFYNMLKPITLYVRDHSTQTNIHEFIIRQFHYFVSAANNWNKLKQDYIAQYMTDVDLKFLVLLQLTFLKNYRAFIDKYIDTKIVNHYNPILLRALKTYDSIINKQFDRLNLAFEYRPNEINTPPSRLIMYIINSK
ncbi:VP80 [Operophtera brumata nucleopolyhedrovirus]|uniref:VP80 n=1 Tax=Operophtera brumata nucleopolyhedrovirus TaxID=1046267 RepID=A0A2H4UZX4_9ABAC|nr:VP80 [Operophtera brumata nucleopolyhedrovirus]AUA60319.1 VP80 [Operophtera brumata nucleopolyhedrovirus]